MDGQDEKLSKQKHKVANRMAFTKFTKLKTDKSGSWECCSQVHSERRTFLRHVSSEHKAEVDALCKEILKKGHADARWSALKVPCHKIEPEQPLCDQQQLLVFEDSDEFPWLPKKNEEYINDKHQENILLFYKYKSLPNVKHIEQWQLCLCERLGLSGKVRVGREGLNGTLAGNVNATELYIQSLQQHPQFSDMTDEDFKRSYGSRTDFPNGLKVGIFSEIVPMGISPATCSYEKAGKHVTADEFHQQITSYLSDEDKRKNTIFVDCRNFYESKIGRFEGALLPSIRKFSYWPEYVEQNLSLFNDKNVFMYCTGGIRCERGSAFLKSKGVCREIYQLSGGIHKYIESYPDGYFRGKLFVFDDRFAIKANEDILAECTYCKEPWDEYCPCSSQHCHQLVLACTRCRDNGSTACCSQCQDNHHNGDRKEECDCTKNRSRIPVEGSL